jgi:hypothetical protein
MGFDGDGVMLMEPESGEHGPAEAQGEEGDEFTEAFGMAKVGGFKADCLTQVAEKLETS